MNEISKVNTDVNKLVDHLFRREAGKITSVLTRIFGVDNLELAEDVVQDTLIKALKQWPYSGIPENPSAWLIKAAKNQAVDLIRREKLKEKYSSEISHFFNSEWTLRGSINEVFSENEIKDGQLRMIFTCCHPALASESQVALSLKILCGFGIKEIAKAFLTNEQTIAKRITRAKEKLRDEKIKFEIPAGDELQPRIKNVLSTIYLLFNEGYNSINPNTLIREDVMEEAIRLAELFAEHPLLNKPEVHALLALMCFHYARSSARIDESGNILLLKDQDRGLWNKEFISKGISYLEDSARGDQLNEYHLEAGIAYFYTTSKNYESIEWKKILALYNLLYEMNQSEIVVLNRAIVISNIEGAQAGINELNKLLNNSSLKNYYLLHSVLGELNIQNGNIPEAKTSLLQALSLAPTNAEKKLIAVKLDKINLPA